VVDPEGGGRRRREETGFSVDGPAIPLGQVRQRSGKVVHAWAVRGDADPTHLRSNSFEVEWPRGSGRMRSFPEVDRAAWFDLAEARRRIVPAQAGLLDALAARVSGGTRE
jgi:predicted NUDIX family NTP pyrophosphohydrolase